MKRSTYEGDVRGWRYGCPSWADQVIGDDVVGQLRLGHDLRNDLVGVERRYEAMKDAIWLSFPEVAVAQAAVDAATEAIEQADRDLKDARQRNRSTAPAAEAARRLRQARQARTAAKAELKVVKDRLKPEMRQRRAELDAAKRCASGSCGSTRRCKGGAGCRPSCHHRCPEPEVPRLRDQWMARGLGWGTYAAIHDGLATEQKQVREQRKAWKPGDPWPRLRFHRWRGEGTLTVQVQRVAGGGLRRQWELVEGRPVPDGAEVTYVKLTRWMEAGQPRWSAALTVRQPKPARSVGGDALAVRLHWDGGDDRSVCVASIAGAPLPPPPADIADLVREVGPGRYELFASPVWRELLERDDRIRSQRGELLHDDEDPSLRPAVVAALKADPALAEQVGVTAAQAAHPRNREEWFHGLARRWAAGHVVDPELHRLLVDELREHYTEQRLSGLSTLELWRMRDQHLRTFEECERRQVARRRRNAWRNAAAWVCAGASFVAIDGRDLATARRAPGIDREDPYAARGDRKLQSVSAPGELRAAIEQAAAKQGVEVNYVDEEVGDATA